MFGFLVDVGTKHSVVPLVYILAEGATRYWEPSSPISTLVVKSLTIAGARI